MFTGDGQAERVVPPTGFTARLTLFASGAMAFLAVFALALSMASGRLATRWSEELARSATVRISAPADQMAAQTERTLRLLQQTPGVAAARAYTDAEQAALLLPWFGPDLPIEDLPIPRLIEVIETEDGFDAAGIRLRLAAEVPGAVLDDHTRWRRPLVVAADRLRLLGWISIGLIGGAMAAMITLAANAALAANRQVIEVLRLVGARDAYIARAFVRRFTFRGLIGATVGMICGVLGILFLPQVSDEGGFLTGLGFSGLGWLWPLGIPALAATVAFLATGVAARRTLRSLA
ncbi:MAG: FtsX-like permease family protein [Pseudomonadota bacterium]